MLTPQPRDLRFFSGVRHGAALRFLALVVSLFWGRNGCASAKKDLAPSAAPHTMPDLPEAEEIKLWLLR
jgi:hypothetical protein